MYQAVTYSLLGLSAGSILFSLFGWVRFDTFDLVGSLIVLLSTAVLTNTAASYIAGKGIRHESAIITALILFFLVAPASNLEGYVSLAFIAAIAIASKYIFAWKGKHIFNPAAIAVVIAPLIGLPAALWWVATPALSVIVLIAGTFLLYRLGRLMVGCAYVLTALIVTTIVSFIGGSFALSDIGLYLTSYPILFLAVYMLTEPLTQAPRDYQRIFIAVGVAALASAQISVLGYFITPEVALILGNIAAFAWSQKSAVRLTFDHHQSLASGYAAYFFKPAKSYRFTPGQYLELTVFHKKSDRRGQRRMFTIASTPEDSLLRIIVRHNAVDSTYKIALSQLVKGQKVEATGIYGDFVLPKNTSQKLLLVAGGIGITPFLSHLASLRAADEECDIVLLYFVNKKIDAVAIDEIKNIPSVTVHVIDKKISSRVLEDLVGDVAERAAYISGPPRMVDAAKASLRSLGAKHIKTDQFDGY